VTLTKLINTKVVLEDGSERGFTKEELEKIILLCKQSEKSSYIKIKEAIGLEKTSVLKNIEDYEIDKETGEFLKNKTTKFVSAFKGFHELRKVVEKTLSKTHWHNISQDTKLLDELGTIFSIHKSDKKISEALDTLNFGMLSDDETIKLKEALIASISFDQFIYLSLKALDKLLPYMREGKRYDEAVSLAGYKKETGTKQKFLRALNKQEQDQLTNPVVKRAIAQTRKVINALIREYGQFDSVHIELTREIKKSHKDRNEIKKGQEKYRLHKAETVEDFIKLFSREPKGAELLKFRLWKEQDGYCAYSGFMGEKAYIIPEKLIDDVKYAEIDHILPYSRSLDDSMNNKVLCLAKENQDKKNMTPFEYFENIGRDWNSYEVYVKNMKNIRKAKRDRLLKKNFDENSEKEFRERNIRDTAYMARYIKNFIEENLELKSTGKKKVVTINGTLTNMLRHNWGVGNKSRDTHLHHAVDAILIAFATDSEVQRLSTLSAKNEGFNYTSSEAKSKKFRFSPPMENFRDEVQKSIDEIFVSNAPRRKVTGAAHKETIRSKKLEKVKGSFEVNGGLAENGEVKRVDVFKKDDKYHFIYLYTGDFEKEKLPNTTIKNIDLDDTFVFQFAIFKDELIEIKQKNKDEIRGYMKFSLSDGRFAISHHLDSNFNATKNRFSTGHLEYIKKYQVDVLGNIQEVKQETRVATKKVLKKNKHNSIKNKTK
jgi:CRISPR-associated endonuclease Csn1